MSLRLSDEQENRRKLGDRLSHERHQFQRDKEATQEVSTGPADLALSQPAPSILRPIWSELENCGFELSCWAEVLGAWRCLGSVVSSSSLGIVFRLMQRFCIQGLGLPHGFPQLIEDLRKQLEHLQLFKLEAEQRRGRSSSVGLQEYNSRTRESELEQEVRRLKQVKLGRHPCPPTEATTGEGEHEGQGHSPGTTLLCRPPQDNRNLKEQNDELNGQIINLSIQGAKNLFSTSFSESLAAEISSVSRDEVKPPLPQALDSRSPQSVCAVLTACSSHSSWKRFRSRKRSTSACRTTLTGSLWPSWRPTHPS